MLVPCVRATASDMTSTATARSILALVVSALIAVTGCTTGRMPPVQENHESSAGANPLAGIAFPVAELNLNAVLVSACGRNEPYLDPDQVVPGIESALQCWGQISQNFTQPELIHYAMSFTESAIKSYISKKDASQIVSGKTGMAYFALWTTASPDNPLFAPLASLFAITKKRNGIYYTDLPPTTVDPGNAPVPTAQAPRSATPPAKTPVPSTGQGASVRADSFTFQSPSGNIACQVGPNAGVGYAVCNIREHDFEPKCATGYDASIGMQQGYRAEFAGCQPEGLMTRTHVGLLYGATWRSGSITCTSETNGITCIDASTTHSFSIARESYNVS